MRVRTVGGGVFVGTGLSTRSFWRRHSQELFAVALVLAGALAVMLHERAYAPFFTDDGFISLRYTDRLLHGEGLTWTDHERVEGYSNLLWVLLCAVPGLFRVDLLTGARALGVLCTAVTLGAVVAAVRPTRPWHWAGAALVMGLFAASDSIAVWSMGGLESPLVGALLSWGIVSALGAARDGAPGATVAAAGCFGLLCWARVDGALWALAAVVGLTLAFRKKAAHVCFAILGGAFAFGTAQLLFRLAYYRDYLPNTAYAKVVLSDQRLENGLEHVKNSLCPLAASWLALVSCGIHGLRRPRLRSVAVLHLVLAAAWTAYVIRIGGDFFPAWRQLTYVVVLAGLFVAFVLGDDLRAPIAPASLRWTASLVVLAALGSHFNDNWAKDEVWQWDGIVVGKTLARMFEHERPLVAVDAAGAIPYASKLPALDMLGLTDRYLAHHRPKSMGAAAMGHELGDASYYLERAPDIICFGVPPCQRDGKFPAQREMVARAEFQRAYAPLRFEASGNGRTLTAPLWVRREGALGIRATPGSVFVPSYFLTTADGAVARLGANGTIEANLPSAARSHVEGLHFAAGAWRLEALAPAGSARFALASGGRVLAAGDAAKPLEFTLAEPSKVDLEVSVQGGSFFTTSGLVFRAGGG
jgi:arabinofuranosyltransferase